MKFKINLALMTITVFALSSCSDNKPESVKDYALMEASNMDYIVSVNTSAYSKEIAEELVQPDPDKPYTEGIIQYIEDDVVSASVDFGEGDEFSAKYSDGDSDETVDLKKDADDKSEFKKVIIEPLVKPTDCDYIVEGIIKFFKGDEWVASFDYGDGTCDEFIEKITEEGNSTFSMNDYPEFNP